MPDKESSARAELELINTLYSVAIEPERFDELIDLWYDRLISVDTGELRVFAGDLDQVYDHLKRADTILGLIEQSGDDLSQPLFEKLNSEPRPTLAIDRNLKVRAANGAAERVWGDVEETGLNTVFSDRDTLEHLRNAVIDLLDRNYSKDTSKPEFLRLTINDEDVIFVLSPWQTSSGQRLALLQSSYHLWPESLSPILQSAFQLTQAEIEVIKLLVEGASIPDTAAQRGSSVATVRSQVNSIYSKTGTRNQTEFMRMMFGLLTINFQNKQKTVGAFEPGISTGRAYPHADHQRFFTLPDGRILDYTDFGPRDGLPCVYFHNDFMANIWPEGAANAAIQAGYRIITPARPYYGQSSPYPNGVITYEQTADDLAALLEHLGIDRVLMVSFTIGGAFALGFAQKHAHRALGHVSIAPAIMVETKAEEAGMPKMYKFMNSIITRHPGLFETVTKLGYAWHARVGTKRYLKKVLGDIPADTAVFEDTDHFEALTRAFRFNAAHQHKGIFNDYRNLMMDSFDVMRAQEFPTFAVVGDSDRNSRLARVKRAIEAGLNIKVTEAKGGGTMLMFTHPKQVIDAMNAAWQWHLKQDN